jgi:hypothetical protein
MGWTSNSAMTMEPTCCRGSIRCAALAGGESSPVTRHRERRYVRMAHNPAPLVYELKTVYGVIGKLTIYLFPMLLMAINWVNSQSLRSVGIQSLKRLVCTVEWQLRAVEG